MKEIIINALSKKGNKALKQHHEETKKIKFKDRLMFKTAGYKQEIINTDPYSIKLILNNRFVNRAHFLGLSMDEIKNVLEQNGAKHILDYSMEVKDV